MDKMENEETEIVELKKKDFTYRGKSLEELKNSTLESLLNI